MVEQLRAGDRSRIGRKLHVDLGGTGDLELDWQFDLVFGPAAVPVLLLVQVTSEPAAERSRPSKPCAVVCPNPVT